jgi:hypothetical protein
MSRNLKLLLVVVICVCCFDAGYKLTVNGSTLPQNSVNFEVAPEDSVVQVDGKKISAGTKDMDIGPHKIVVTHEGFETYKTTLDVDQSGEQYIGVILKSASKDTTDWYTDHPSDQKLSESISDHLNDASAQNISTKYPLLSTLPAVFGDGSGGLTRIESETAINNSGKPVLGIYAAGPAQRQAALVWINSRNYSLSDLDVVFYGTSIPVLEAD